MGVLQSSSKETNQIGIKCQLYVQLPPPNPQHHKILIIRCCNSIPVGHSIYKNFLDEQDIPTLTPQKCRNWEPSKNILLI